ncbi:hypothetical protein ACWCOV_12575 [Kribbella sp. NPDC002412]
MDERSTREIADVEPHSIAYVVNGSEFLLVRLPLPFHNAGAKPIIVQNLRLRFPNEAGAINGLPWRVTRRQLRPEGDDYEDLPAVFSVAGRTVVQKYIEFGGPFPGLALEPREYFVRVEAKLAHKKDWVSVAAFPLRAQNITSGTTYIAHSNDSGYLSANDLANAKAAGLALLEQLRAASPRSG